MAAPMFNLQSRLPGADRHGEARTGKHPPPVSCTARLSREQAAAYVGVSPSLFDTLVKDGRMPTPKRINARTVWDRVQLDVAFAALPSNDTPVNPWDEIAA